MTTTGYRITFALLGVALIVIIGGSVLLIPAGNPENLPPAVERYSPSEGDTAVNPVKVMIDLKPNYAAQFVIDGIGIPQVDLDSIPETGRYQFVPGPGKVIERWAAGDHTVVATWVGGSNNVDSGTLVWTFRVQ
jgi:hypothetical protein